MAHPDAHKATDVAKRFGRSLTTLVRRVADDPLRQAGSAAAASRTRVQELLGLGSSEQAPRAAAPSQPVIPLINLRRSLGRAAVPCENQDVCGGIIELALYEHSATNSEVGETTVTEASMINQTCECILSEEERDHVLERVQREIRMRG